MSAEKIYDSPSLPPKWNPELPIQHAAARYFADLAVYIGRIGVEFDRLDKKTRLLHAAAFQEEVVQRVIYADRQEDKARIHSVLFMDLVDFKPLNEQLTHPYVDEHILLPFVSTLGRQCRKEDLLGRFGGEEFLAFLPDTTPVQAVAFAARLQQEIAPITHTVSPDLPPLAVSVGIAPLHQGGDYSDSLRFATLAERFVKQQPDKAQIAILEPSDGSAEPRLAPTPPMT